MYAYSHAAMRPEGCNSELSATTRPKIADNWVDNNIKTSKKPFLSCTVYDARDQKKNPTLLRLAFTYSENNFSYI